MGAQRLNEITLNSKRDEYENELVTQGESYLLFKHYHLGNPIDMHKLFHLGALYTAHSSDDCNVTDFIEKQLEPKHEYKDIANDRYCEEFDICYNQ